MYYVYVVKYLCRQIRSCRVSLGSSWLWQLLRLVFGDFDSFEEYLSGILWDVPQLGFIWCFSLLIRLRLCIVQKKSSEIKCHFVKYLWYVVSTWFITVYVNLDHLLFVRFLHCKVALLSLSILGSLKGNHSKRPTRKESGARALTP